MNCEGRKRRDRGRCSVTFHKASPGRPRSRALCFLLLHRYCKVINTEARPPSQQKDDDTGKAQIQLALLAAKWFSVKVRTVFSLGSNAVAHLLGYRMVSVDLGEALGSRKMVWLVLAMFAVLWGSGTEPAIGLRSACKFLRPQLGTSAVHLTTDRQFSGSDLPLPEGRGTPSTVFSLTLGHVGRGGTRCSLQLVLGVGLPCSKGGFPHAGTQLDPLSSLSCVHQVGKSNGDEIRVTLRPTGHTLKGVKSSFLAVVLNGPYTTLSFPRNTDNCL